MEALTLAHNRFEAFLIFTHADSAELASKKIVGALLNSRRVKPPMISFPKLVAGVVDRGTIPFSVWERWCGRQVAESLPLRAPFLSVRMAQKDEGFVERQRNRDSLMGRSFVKFKGHGFWTRDEYLLDWLTAAIGEIIKTDPIEKWQVHVAAERDDAIPPAESTPIWTRF